MTAGRLARLAAVIQKRKVLSDTLGQLRDACSFERLSRGHVQGDDAITAKSAAATCDLESCFGNT